MSEQQENESKPAAEKTHSEGKKKDDAPAREAKHAPKKADSDVESDARAVGLPR